MLLELLVAAVLTIAVLAAGLGIILGVMWLDNRIEEWLTK